MKWGGNRSVKCSGGNSWQGRHCGGKPTPSLRRQPECLRRKMGVCSAAVSCAVRAYTTWEQHLFPNSLTSIIVLFLAISVDFLSTAGKISWPCDCNMMNELGRLISAKGIRDKVNFHFILTLGSTANLSQKHPGSVHSHSVSRLAL